MGSIYYYSNMTEEGMEQWRNQAALQRECELELTAIMKERAKVYNEYEAAKAVIIAKRQAVRDKMEGIQEAMVNICIQSRKPFKSSNTPEKGAVYGLWVG